MGPRPNNKVPDRAFFFNGCPFSQFPCSLCSCHLQYGQITLVGQDKTNNDYTEVHVHSFGTSDLIYPGDKVSGWVTDGETVTGGQDVLKRLSGMEALPQGASLVSLGVYC